MKKIILDVDDVVSGGSFLKSVNLFMGTNYKEEDINGYYIQDLLAEKKELYFSNFENVNLYKDAVLNDNCYEVLKRLNEKFEIYFCSAFVWREVPDKSSNNLKYKYDFLYNNFPFVDPNNYIFTSSKKILNADIRIDDRIENLGEAELNILYTAYHNKDIDKKELELRNIIRVNNWLELESLLNQYL